MRPCLDFSPREGHRFWLHHLLQDELGGELSLSVPECSSPWFSKMLESAIFLLGETYNFPRNIILALRAQIPGSGQVAHLVRVWPQYAKILGSISGQGIYKNQTMNA